MLFVFSFIFIRESLLSFVLSLVYFALVYVCVKKQLRIVETLITEIVLRLYLHATLS